MTRFMNNGSRLITYVIEAAAGSGTIMLNGPAAHLGAEGDEVVILTYCNVETHEAGQLKACVVFVDADNRVRQKPEGGNELR